MYKNIIMPEKIYGDDVVEVTEIFLYTCPHCFRIHPFAEKWKKTVEGQKDVVFNPMPAVFSEKNIPLAKAFYIARDLGREELHGVLFEMIHSKGRHIVTKHKVKAFFLEQGVKEEAFEKSYKSFAVDNSVRSARFLTSSYGISGVPALVVNGKYLILSSKAKGYDKMFKVVDYLIEKERKAIAENKAAATEVEETKEIAENKAAATEVEETKEIAEPEAKPAE